jgi:hypothetical protein
MLTPEESSDIRHCVHDEMAIIEQMVAWHGSFHYICECGGNTFLCHKPVGRIIREMPH